MKSKTTPYIIPFGNVYLRSEKAFAALKDNQIVVRHEQKITETFPKPITYVSIYFQLFDVDSLYMFYQVHISRNEDFVLHELIPLNRKCNFFMDFDKPLEKGENTKPFEVALESYKKYLAGLSEEPVIWFEEDSSDETKFSRHLKTRTFTFENIYVLLEFATTSLVSFGETDVENGKLLKTGNKKKPIIDFGIYNPGKSLRMVKSGKALEPKRKMIPFINGKKSDVFNKQMLVESLLTICKEEKTLEFALTEEIIKSMKLDIVQVPAPENIEHSSGAPKTVSMIRKKKDDTKKISASSLGDLYAEVKRVCIGFLTPIWSLILTPKKDIKLEMTEQEKLIEQPFQLHSVLDLNTEFELMGVEGFYKTFLKKQYVAKMTFRYNSSFCPIYCFKSGPSARHSIRDGRVICFDLETRLVSLECPYNSRCMEPRQWEKYRYMDQGDQFKILCDKLKIFF